VSGYVLGVDADFDLDDIWEFIAADNIDAADRWIGKLFDAFESPWTHSRHGTPARRPHWVSGFVLAGWRVPRDLPR
jgi:plasmid stabilization system protein ParE